MITIYLKSAYGLKEVKDESIRLAIIHHPFSLDDNEYMETGRAILEDCSRVIISGGIVVIIQHDLKKLRTAPRHMILYAEAIRAGFVAYDQKIWHRQEALNLFRKTYGYISILSKDKPGGAVRSPEYIQDVWTFPDSMRRGDYKDAFSKEIPALLIKTFTREGDVVLDPFLGSGTTAYACEENNRECIGYEIDSELRKFYKEEWQIIDQ